MPKTSDIINAKVGNVSLVEMRVGTTIVWPIAYTYNIRNVRVRYNVGSYIYASGANYAYITADIDVYRGITYIETRTNETLTPLKTGGDSAFSVSGNNITAANRHTTSGLERTATFVGVYGDTQSSSITVRQQANTPTYNNEYTYTLSSSTSVISRTGGNVRIGYVSTFIEKITWTSGDHETKPEAPSTSRLSANIGSLSSSSVSGSNYVTLTVPPNTAFTTRDVVVTITAASGASRSITFTQEAAEIQYTYVVTRAYAVYSNGGNILLAKGSDSIGGNYAILKGDVEVYRNGSLYNTLYDVSLDMHRESGDSAITISNGKIVAPYLGTTPKSYVASAYFTGTYETSDRSDSVQVSQEANIPTSERTYNIDLTATSTEIDYTGGSIRINYTSLYTDHTVWTSGAEETTADQPATSDLYAGRGTLSSDRVSGSGYVTLTVPRNSTYNPISFNVVITSPSGATKTLSFTQGAMERPIEWYIDVTESTRAGYRDITIKNNYTSALSGYVRCDIYDEYGSFVTYTEISFALAPGATKPATRIYYGYGYNVTYTKHVN